MQRIPTTPVSSFVEKQISNLRVLFRSSYSADSAENRHEREFLDLQTMCIIVIIENERDWRKLDKVRGNFVVLCIPSYSRYFDTWVIELWNNRGGKSVQYSGILNTKYDNRIFSSSDPARKENRRVFPMKIWNFWEIALYRTRLIPNERSIIRYMPERVLIRLIRSLVSLNSLTRHISLEARIARNEGDRSRHRS